MAQQVVELLQPLRMVLMGCKTISLLPRSRGDLHAHAAWQKKSSLVLNLPWKLCIKEQLTCGMFNGGGMSSLPFSLLTCPTLVPSSLQKKKSQAQAIMSCSISDCRFAIIIIIIKRPLLSIPWNKNSKFQLIKFYEQQ